MKVRHSRRSYDPDKVVHQEEINMLIEDARLSPSCFGDEPWRYIICNKQSNQNSLKDLLSCLTEPNQNWIKNAQVLIISLSSKNFRKPDKGKNFWAKHDTGAANYALILLAASMNLTAHQMSGFDRNKIEEKFNIPGDFNIMSVMAVVYAEEVTEIKKKARRPIKEIFFYD
ncbi:nitroreductase family protein [Wolbachia pipientis]|uniref:nitroreductase family protein n=1 Tax=Wolbachia pipientis TaxID=955 RepID=UPI0025A44CD4|nr:nitroreductase family protein [Wolbachia pipientis]MDM8335714.1 nitroreductase family protein [Wolbachia pipientis]